VRRRVLAENESENWQKKSKLTRGDILEELEFN
jgi:hypothetical protein